MLRSFLRVAATAALALVACGVPAIADDGEFVVIVEASEGFHMAAFIYDGPSQNAKRIFESAEPVTKRVGGHYFVPVKGLSVEDAVKICVANVLLDDFESRVYGCVRQGSMSVVPDYNPPAVLMKYDPPPGD